MSTFITPAGPEVVTKSGPGATAPVQTPGKTVVPTALPPAAPDTAAELAKLDSARKAIELKERSHVVNVRKFSEEKKTLGEKLTEYEQYKKEKAQAKLNPDAFLKSIYGEKYYDVLVETRVNGVPPAQLLAESIAGIEEKVNKKFEERDAEAAKARTESSRQAVDTARRQLHSEMLGFVKANAKDYPVFKALGDEARVGALLAQRIEAEYKRTEQRDAEGRLVQPGRILTSTEAANLLESEVLALAEEAAAHEKYQPKLREKLQPPKPPPPAPGGLPQQRRTLSNDLTGSTPSGRTAPTTDAEKRDRAIAARNAAVAAKVRP